MPCAHRVTMTSESSLDGERPLSGPTWLAIGDACEGELIESGEEIVFIRDVRHFERTLPLATTVAPHQARVRERVALDAIGRRIGAVRVEVALIAHVNARRER